MKLKHCFQRAVAVTMACLMLLCMSGTALAADSQAPAKVGYKQLTQEQMNGKDYSITLHYTTTNTENPQPLPQTAFRLYKVADMNSNIQFTPTEEFGSYPVFTPTEDGYVKINELNAAGWEALATTLSGYVNAENAAETLAPLQTETTDASGEASFAGLGVGLYLIVGAPSYVGSTRYTPTPALVALPSWINSEWEFAVASNLKYTTYTPSGPGGGDTISRSVLKIWNDEGYEDERPASIQVSLLRDGSVYDTVTLNASNNWRHTWNGLRSSYQWELIEEAVSDDYTVSIERSGSTFTVTNTYTADIDDPDTPLDPGPGEDPGDPGTDIPDENPPTTDPDTPDDPDIEIPDEEPPLADLPQTGVLWWPVPVLAVAGVVMILLGVTRRRNGEV